MYGKPAPEVDLDVATLRQHLRERQLQAAASKALGMGNCGGSMLQHMTTCGNMLQPMTNRVNMCVRKRSYIL